MYTIFFAGLPTPDNAQGGKFKSGPAGWLCAAKTSQALKLTGKPCQTFNKQHFNEVLLPKLIPRR